MTDNNQDSEQLVRCDGELIAVALPHPSAMQYALRWDLSFDHGSQLSCGVASLRPPLSDAVASFVFDDPATLTSVSVPFGVVIVDEDLDTDEDESAQQILDQAGMSRMDAAIVRRLVGEDTVRDMHSAWSISTQVRTSDAWRSLGRVALAQASLADRRLHCDGLWALEIAAELAALDEHELRPWVLDLMSAAQPALLHTSAQWLEWLQPSTVSRLKTLFSLARNAGAVELGPLSDHLRAEDERAVLAEAEAVVIDASLRLSTDDEADAGLSATAAAGAEPELAGPVLGEPLLVLGRSRTRNPVFDRVLGATERWQEARITHDAAQFGLSKPEFHVAGNELRVRVKHDPSVPPQIARRISVRVTAGNSLIASSSGLGVDPVVSTLLAASLTIPSGMESADLSVVIGKDLPFSPISNAELEELEQTRRNRSQAIEQWRVAELGGVKGLVADLLASDFRARPEAQQLPEPGDSADDLSGARSIALMLGRDDAAAEFEERRQRLQDRLDELGIPELERLALAAAKAGRAQVSESLAASTVEILMAGF